MKTKIEMLNLNQKKQLCSLMAAAALQELIKPAYSNALDYFGLGEPDGFDYTGEPDNEVYQEVENAIIGVYYAKLLFLAAYNPEEFYSFAAEDARPLGEIVTAMDDLPDDPTEDEFEEWLNNLSGEFG